MAAVEFFEQAGGPDVRHGLQEGHEVLAPDLGEGIGAGAIGAQRLLAGSGRTGLDAAPVRSLKPAWAAATACVRPSRREVM
jgi:hypothetical protein